MFMLQLRITAQSLRFPYTIGHNQGYNSESEEEISEI